MATKAVTTNADVIRRFEEEFKNQLNPNITDELTAPDVQHRLPYKGLPPGRDGLRAIQQTVGQTFADIHVKVEILVAEGDYVADRVSGTGTRRSNGQPTTWVEHELYRLENGKIKEFWAMGGPEVG
jgi:predicted ester cyclase